jgi:hypothetical protein
MNVAPLDGSFRMVQLGIVAAGNREEFSNENRTSRKIILFLQVIVNAVEERQIFRVFIRM